MKIVIHTTFGGFSLTSEFEDKYPDIYFWEVDRHDPRLIKSFENGEFDDDYKMVEIPDNHIYVIDDYDGIETIYHAKELFINGEKQKVTLINK